MRAAYYPDVVGKAVKFRMPIVSKQPVPGRGTSDRLRISIVGGFTLGCGSQALRPLGRKAQALMGYLTLSDVERVSRERLVGLLWSGSGEQHARGSLRHAVLDIQTVLRRAGYEGGPFRSDKLMLGLDRSFFDVDLWDVLAKAKAGQVHPLLLERSRICDTILAGLDTVDPAFGSWLQEARQTLQSRLAGYLEGALPPEDAATVAPAAETIARALAMLDPANERAARLIIRSRWATGDIGTALRTYDELWKHLEQEFDTEPSPETQDLIAKLRLSQPEATAPVTTPAATYEIPARILGGYDARPSIAVLPFTTLGPADERYFGDGIVDDIIHAMAGLKDLFVIAKGSTRNYRGTAPDVKAIGQDLGVRYVLYGNVQRSGDQLRIRTSLADSETAEIVKPSRYDGRMSDLFDLQDQIAIETTKAIAPFVRERELRRAMRKHPQSMTAYDLVLQAVGPLHDLEYATFSRARTLLHRAIELDPTYSPGYSRLAHWHCYRIGQLWSTDIAADTREAEQLATTAISLDSTDAIALAVHAHVMCVAHRNYAASRDAFQTALAASPNSAFAWTLSAVTESCSGRGADGVLHALTALKLSPADNFIHYTHGVLAQSYFVDGDFEAAARYGRIANERNKRFAANLRVLAASLVEIGHLEEARDIVAQHICVVPRFTLSEWAERTWIGAAARDKIATNLRCAGMPE